MQVKSTSMNYGKVAIAIHWTSALAVVMAFGAGFTVANVSENPAILIAHIILGSLVLVLTLLRIVWWWVADRRPALPSDQPHWQRLTARLVHGALYAILLLMAASGIATLILSGAIPTILAGGPVPDFSALLPRVTHGLMSRLLLALLVLHIGAALYHQFIRRDRLLARMGVGSA